MIPASPRPQHALCSPQSPRSHLSTTSSRSAPSQHVTLTSRHPEHPAHYRFPTGLPSPAPRFCARLRRSSPRTAVLLTLPKTQGPPNPCLPTPSLPVSTASARPTPIPAHSPRRDSPHPLLRVLRVLRRQPRTPARRPRPQPLSPPSGPSSDAPLSPEATPQPPSPGSPSHSGPQVISATDPASAAPFRPGHRGSGSRSAAAASSPTWSRSARPPPGELPLSPPPPPLFANPEIDLLPLSPASANKMEAGERELGSGAQGPLRACAPGRPASRRRTSKRKRPGRRHLGKVAGISPTYRRAGFATLVSAVITWEHKRIV